MLRNIIIATLVVGIINLFGLFYVSKQLSSLKRASENQVLGSEVTAQIADLKTSLKSLQPAPTATPGVLPATTPSEDANKISQLIITPQNYLTTKQSTTIHAEGNTTSAEIGQTAAGANYPYSKKENNWYYIQLPDGKSGWISGSAAQEL